MRTKQKIALFGSLRTLVLSSIFVAVSIVCGKYLAIPGGNVLRFSFENLPVLLAGMSFGPVVGMAVGVAADLLGSLLRGYDINLMLTLGAAVIGLVGGIVFRLCRSLSDIPRVTLTVSLAHLLGSVIIKTAGLSLFYDMPLYELMLWRLLNYAIVGALEGGLLCLLIRNRTLRTYLNLTEKERNS
jgi:ECF transporter S component (folate family)